MIVSIAVGRLPCSKDEVGYAAKATAPNFAQQHTTANRGEIKFGFGLKFLLGAQIDFEIKRKK